MSSAKPQEAMIAVGDRISERWIYALLPYNSVKIRLTARYFAEYSFDWKIAY